MGKFTNVALDHLAVDIVGVRPVHGAQIFFD
jgi:hypothetical protein